MPSTIENLTFSYASTALGVRGVADASAESTTSLTSLSVICVSGNAKLNNTKASSAASTPETNGTIPLNRLRHKLNFELNDSLIAWIV